MYEAIAGAYLAKLVLAGPEGIYDFIVKLKSDDGYFFFSLLAAKELEVLKTLIEATVKFLKYIAKEEASKDRMSLFIYYYDEITKSLAEILKAIEQSFYFYNPEEDWKNSTVQALAIALRISIKIDQKYEACAKNLKYLDADSLNWHEESIVIFKSEKSYIVPFILVEEKKVTEVYDMKTSILKLIEYYLTLENAIPYKSIELIDMDTVCKNTSLKQPVIIPPAEYKVSKVNPSFEETRIYYIALISAKYLFDIKDTIFNTLYKRKELIRGVLDIIELRSLKAAVNFELYLTLQITSLDSFKEFISEMNPHANKLEKIELKFKDILELTDELYGPLDRCLPESKGWILYLCLHVIEELQRMNKEGYYFGEFSARNLYFNPPNRLAFVSMDDKFEYMLIQKDNKIPINLLSPGLGTPPELNTNESIDRDNIEKAEVYYIGLLIAQLYLGITTTELHIEVEHLFGRRCSTEEYTNVVNHILEMLKVKSIKSSVIEIIKRCLKEKPVKRPDLKKLRSKIKKELSSDN